MIVGLIQNPQEGNVYRVELSNGSMENYKYLGMGEYMAQKWKNVETGIILNEIPPYSKHQIVESN